MDKLLTNHLALKSSVQSLVSQVSELQDREAEGSSSNPETVTEVSVRAVTASPTQIEVQIGDLHSPLSQDPKPPIISNCSVRDSRLDLISNLKALAEVDPSYQISDGKKPQKDSIGASVYNSDPIRPEDGASQKGSLQTQNSYDSLRTVISHSDRTSSPVIPETRERDSVLFKNLSEVAEDLTSGKVIEETKNLESSKEGTFNKTYKSLFGGPSSKRVISDPFVGRQKSPTDTQSNFHLPERKLDSYPGKAPIRLPNETGNLALPTNTTNTIKPNLPAIPERKSEDGSKANTGKSTSAIDQSFISAEDLLARLAVQPVRKLTPIPGQSVTNPKARLLTDKKMDFLKRGERRRPAPPSLRRAGSQIESPNASSEHIIFGGGGYQAPENRGKGEGGTKKADIYVGLRLYPIKGI